MYLEIRRQVYSVLGSGGLYREVHISITPSRLTAAPSYSPPSSVTRNRSEVEQRSWLLKAGNGTPSLQEGGPFLQ